MQGIQPHSFFISSQISMGIRGIQLCSAACIAQPHHQQRGNNMALSSAFLQLLCSQVMTLVSPWYAILYLLQHIYLFFYYCWPAFISSLTLLTLASIWQLNTLHYSAMFTIRTDMQLIAAFFISNPWGHMELPLSEPCKISYRWFSFSVRFLLKMSLQDSLNVKMKSDSC